MPRPTGYANTPKRERVRGMSSPRGCGGRSRGVGESSAKVSGGGGSESVDRGAAAVLRASGCRIRLAAVLRRCTRVREVRGSPEMSNWPEIGVYRGWGARRDSGDAVQELERRRLRKNPRVEAERPRRSAGPGVRWRGRRTAARVLCAAERGEVVARVAGWRLGRG